VPKLTNSLPKLRRHASGNAVVTLYGQDRYLGPYGSPASKAEYNRLVGEWVSAGRPTSPSASTAGQTVVELARDYRRFAETYYQKNGVPTDTIYQVVRALALLNERYGRTQAHDFGPLALQAYQDYLVEKKLARTTINHYTAIVRQMFKWAVAQEKVPPSVLQGLQAVPGLRKGKSAAREPDPVRPVDDSVVDATLVALPPVVADMVRFQRLTGCRPDEVCSLRPGDIDRTEGVWWYVPEHHKTEHHGRERVIAIGPQAQKILERYLTRTAPDFCFSPRDSERARNLERRKNRRSPMTPSQARRRPKRHPRRTPGERYDANGYRQVIARAVQRINRQRTVDAAKTGVKPQLLPHWHPNQLRHTAATKIRAAFGVEAAQVILGHSRADVTQIYAERDEKRAAEVMRQIG